MKANEYGPGIGTSNGSAFAHVEVWIFDLDNTLYPSSCHLFAQVDERIRTFIARHFGVPQDQARRLQRDYGRTYGTTMRGLMVEQGIDPAVFLDYVHAIDLTTLAPDPGLDHALGNLPGRKLIYTNASEQHAERVLGKLAIAHHFEHIHDIVAADYLPKPDPKPYAQLAARQDISPETACMVDDMARNLLPAARMGWTTVWLKSSEPWRQPDPGSPSPVDHAIDDLVSWLRSVPDNQTHH